MADAPSIKHHLPINGGSFLADLKNISSHLKTRKIVALAYGFLFVFVAVTVFIAFAPSSNSNAPRFTNIFSPSPTASAASSGSQFSSIYSYFYPAIPQQLPLVQPLNDSSFLHAQNATTIARSNATVSSKPPRINPEVEIPSDVQNHTQISVDATDNTASFLANQSSNSSLVSKEPSFFSNRTQNTKNSSGDQGLISNLTSVAPPEAPTPAVAENEISNVNSTISLKKEKSENEEKDRVVKSQASNYTASLLKKQSSVDKQSNVTNSGKRGIEGLGHHLMNCDLFDGMWVMDDSYPLYKPGSCSLIDEQFNCIINGRPDKDFQKYKWKPNGCTLPRLNAAHMLELLRGKRVVFVGDSLNRNMWESLICILKNSVKDQSKVFEANGRDYFRGEASYSFIFKDYGFSIEFFVSPFLVQEWEVDNKDGSKKETLRLDLVGRAADHYKSADIIVFNTGHWWSHDKTSKGLDYYQEGSHVYDELNVLEAFRKAMTTWGRWIDKHVNPSKSFVLFRGYSHSHFSGGQWNSGGACDSQVEPINNTTYLRQYEPMMQVLEKVLKKMKTRVAYLNVTQMTDYRKDAHPSIYRKQKITDEERKSPMLYQDCSHWCLPGVPDAWNEILYAELLINERQKQQVQKRHR